VIIDLSSAGTQTQLAELVGVSQQAISQTGIESGPLGQMLLDYCCRLREVAAGRAAGGSLDLASERALLAREQRLGLEIKNATLRGEYASVRLLAEVLATASQAVSERFDHLPGVLRKVLPDMEEAQRDQILAVIADARNEWVRATAELVAVRLDDSDDDSDDSVYTDEAGS
jgi:phage terminase Nu1 subunit (DNA packaging protein)